MRVQRTSRDLQDIFFFMHRCFHIVSVGHRGNIWTRTLLTSRRAPHTMSVLVLMRSGRSRTTLGRSRDIKEDLGSEVPQAAINVRPMVFDAVRGRGDTE